MLLGDGDVDGRLNGIFMKIVALAAFDMCSLPVVNFSWKIFVNINMSVTAHCSYYYSIYLPCILE